MSDFDSSQFSQPPGQQPPPPYPPPPAPPSGSGEGGSGKWIVIGLASCGGVALLCIVGTIVVIGVLTLLGKKVSAVFSEIDSGLVTDADFSMPPPDMLLPEHEVDGAPAAPAWKLIGGKLAAAARPTNLFPVHSIFPPMSRHLPHMSSSYLTAFLRL